MTSHKRAWLLITLLLTLGNSAFAAIIGNHENANATTTSGWTCDNVNTGETLAVHFYRDNGIFIDGVMANINREAAVGNLCGGNSARGFTYSFPASLNDGKTHAIYAYGLNTTTGASALLGNSPITVTFPAAPPPPPPANIIGNHDSATGSSTTGWACDSNKPAETLNVQFVLENGTVAGTVPANQSREAAVGSLCGGNSARGFTFAFPASLYDGLTHQVSAYGVNAAGVRKLLGSSPKQVTFPSAAQPPTCAAAFPQSSTTTATSGGFTLTATGVQNATQVWFPTWADPQQRDIVWYPGSPVGNGTWQAVVNLGNHFAGNPIYGTFAVHVYVANSPTYGPTYCAGTGFTRVVATRSARFDLQSVPNVMVAGRMYPIEIVATNTGNVTWTSAEAYRLGFANPRDGVAWGLNRVVLPRSVAPNESVSFLFNVTAPSTPGTYNFQWDMVQEGVAWFSTPTPNVAVSVIPATPKQIVISQALAADAFIKSPVPQSSPGQLVLQINGFGSAGAAAAVSWDVGSFTGFSTALPYASFQRGPADIFGGTAAQSYGHTVGMWIDTQVSPPNATITNISLAFAPPGVMMPWGVDTNLLNSSLDMNVRTASGGPGKEVYAGLAYLFLDTRNNRQVYLSQQMFDLRGVVTEFATFDSCDICSKNVILASSLKDGTLWGHRTTPFVEPSIVTGAFNVYGYSVSKVEFERALAAGNSLIMSRTPACANAQSVDCKKALLSPHAEDYRLLDIEAGAEANAAVPGGRLGVSMRNLRVTID
jgi:GBS Bsp-like repeat-containing protein